MGYGGVVGGVVGKYWFWGIVDKIKNKNNYNKRKIRKDNNNIKDFENIDTNVIRKKRRLSNQIAALGFVENFKIDKFCVF